MKMSPRNCSVKMSPRYGDLHDEQEGSASGGPRKSRFGGEDHQRGGSRSIASDGPAVQTPQGARSHGGCSRVAASCAGPPGPASPRRRAPKHRSRRDRAPALGQLAQLDGSPFAWFEERGPVSTLHGVIDDATSLPLALGFRPTEDLHGYFTVLRQVCRTYGVPTTLYGDRLNVFQRNDHHWTLEEELRGKQDPTHFGRALQDLGVGFIAAQSPQAKGRIERLWATLQDRLTSELRLRGIATLEAANAYLPEFLADFQRRFPTPPASPTAAWRPAPCDLELILSCRYRRVVARDNTVQLGGRWLQVPPGPGGASYAGRRLEVRELLDGRLVVMLDGRPLVTQPSPSPDFVLTPRTAPSADRRPHAASPDPRRLLRQAPAQPATPRAAPRTPPPPRHPWRQAFKRETRLSHPIKG